MYVDTEGTYSGNFSNVYEKGTKYYAISRNNHRRSNCLKKKVSIEKQLGLESREKYNFYFFTNGVLYLKIGAAKTALYLVKLTRQFS